MNLHNIALQRIANQQIPGTGFNSAKEITGWMGALQVLRDNNHLTRKELFGELVKAKLRVNRDQASHIFVRAEMEGIICSGRQKAGKPTYAILGERVLEDKMKLYLPSWKQDK